MQEINFGKCLADVAESLSHSTLCLLRASTGLGKTVKAPLYLREALNLNKVLVLEPRAIAAIGAASFVAKQNGLVLGKDVGYRTGIDSRAQSDCKIEYMTDAVFARKIAEDPTLEGVDLVVFDEFHERTLWNDTSWALLQASQEFYNCTAKVLVMSATLDFESSATFDKVPKHEYDARRYPVQITHCSIDRTSYASIANLIEDEAKKIASGTILVFLPTVMFIDQIHQRLRQSISQIEVLHGRLNAEQQRFVLRSTPDFRVVLSTNIAEASVTISDVVLVIDSGLNQVAKYDQFKDRNTLNIESISQASATQRAGRAGRTQEGRVLRLWSTDLHATLYNFDAPAILREDLVDVVFLCARWGSSELSDYAWLEPPGSKVWQAARTQLVVSGIIDPYGEVKEYYTQGGLPSVTARYLPLVSGAHSALDLMIAMGLSYGFSQTQVNLLELNAPLLSSQARRRLARQTAITRVDKAETTNRLLAISPKKLAQRHAKGVYRDANGVEYFSDHIFSPWILVLSAYGKPLKVGAYVELSDELAEHHITGFGVVEKKVELSGEQPACIEYLKLGRFERNIKRIPLKGSAYSEWLVNQPESVLLSQLGETLRVALSELEKRLRFLGEPFQLEHALREGVKLWTSNDFSAESWKSISPKAFVESLIDYHMVKKLELEAPRTWKGPLGEYRIDYDGENPIVRCRLQAVLGTKVHPTINGCPIIFELLSPAQRPIQTTRDLPQFWTSSYKDVKKEMKGRYPKHPWPDNPQEYTPTLLTKRAGG